MSLLLIVVSIEKSRISLPNFFFFYIDTPRCRTHGFTQADRPPKFTLGMVESESLIKTISVLLSLKFRRFEDNQTFTLVKQANLTI